jgi:hypothetical protein
MLATRGIDRALRTKFKTAALSAAIALAVAGLLPAAHAATVNATDVIYAAGTQSGVASSAGGSVPTGYSVAGIASITFSVTGQVILNDTSGSNLNDPDGVGAAPGSSSETGAGSISGISAPDAGYLVGVFIGAGGPSGAAPAALDYTSTGTAFASASPLLDQTFFIGDGLTGDGTGSPQTFYVPGGASQLYLGISDACGYNGGPSCYGDNTGTFDVTLNETPSSTSPIPEPSSFVLMASGALAMAGALRRRFARV